MQLKLRVGRAACDPPGNGLEIIERLAARARDISHDSPEFAVVEQRCERRHGAQQFGVHWHACRDRVPLLLAAAVRLNSQKRRLQRRELGRRQEVANGNEAIALEGVPEVRRNHVREPRAAPRSQPVRRIQPPGVQTQAVQPRRAKDRVVDEALGAGENRGGPDRRAQPWQCAAGTIRGRGTHTGVEGHGSSLLLE